MPFLSFVVLVVSSWFQFLVGGAIVLDGRRGEWGRGCTITAAAGVVLVVLTILGGCAYDRMWERRLEAKLQEYRAAGQPATWPDMLATRPRVPPEENAALVLMEAFDALGDVYAPAYELAERALVRSEGAGRRNSTPMLELARSQLPPRARVLEAVHEAARLDTAVYPLDPDVEPLAMLLPYLASLRWTARLICMEAVCRMQSGDTGGVADVLLDCAALPASLAEEVTLIAGLVRIAVDAIWADGVEQTLGLGELPVAELAVLRSAVAREERNLSIERGLIGERTIFHETVRRLYSRERPKGQHGDHARALRLRSLVPGWREQEALFYFETLTDAARIAAMPVPERVEEARRHAVRTDRFVNAQPRGKLFLSVMLMPATSRAINEEARGHAELRVAAVALAVEEWRLVHGDWPESLDVLVPELLDALPVDPFSGGALGYRQRSGGVVVYSVGFDGRDDGGITQAEASEGAEDPVYDGWDMGFHLLNPDLRGAGTMTFRDEVMATGLGLPSLEAAGFPEGRLLELGLTEEDINQLR